MLRSELISLCAQSSGVSPREIEAVLTDVETTIGQQLAKRNGPVRVDDFGTFEWFKGGIVFRASPILLQAVNQPSDNTPMPEPKPLGPASAADAEGRFVLPVRPIGAEDRELIERWLQARTGASPGATEAMILLTDPGKRMAIGTPQSRERARKALESFARRCPVPLIQVGMSRHAGELAGYEHGALIKEVVDYLRDYLERARPRLAKYKDSRVARNLGWKEMAIRSQGWKTFFNCALDFYKWLESAGLRPKGSNPFAALPRPKSLDMSRGQRVLVRKWAREMLRFDRMTPKERAILFLAGHGLRASEVAGARLENLSIREKFIKIVGKLNKTRVVWLLPEAVPALEAYLESRRNSTSPWLFPGERQGRLIDKPITYSAIYQLIARVRDATFPMPDQAHIRAMISPHKFRHYFITNAWARGMKPRNIMEQTGISNPGTLERYITPDPVDVRRDIAYVTKTRFF